VSRSLLRDVIVVVPGILGSVLQRDGRDVWNVSMSAASQAAKSGGGSLRDLQLDGDEDGVVATSLMQESKLIPGIHKIDGYTRLKKMVDETFEVVPGGNYLEFAYDWRRDNRDSGRKLGEAVTARLRQWREQSGAADAKAIVLAHSMGGLLARYWLECLDGWPECRALITFGTPHRGALDTVGYLANGYKKLFVDLTDAMRSFPSAHQLLPIYPSLRVDEAYVRVADHAVGGVDADLARDGLAFHREIEAAVNAHLDEDAYRHRRYALLPIVGVRQATNQSATLADGRLRLTKVTPSGIDSRLAGGDGTVPRVSATPIELSNAYMDTFAVERHAALQSNTRLLEDIRERIASMQAVGLEEVRSAKEEPARERQPAFGLDLEDAYVDDEPIVLDVDGLDLQAPPGPVWATITPIDGPAAPIEVNLTETDAGWRGVAGELSTGLYRISIAGRGGGSFAPTPLHDIFMVVAG
jgi:pimeloyl-ACP methyl ester carboxylesterase